MTDVGYTVALRYGPSPRTAGQFVYVTGFSAQANLGFVEGASRPDPAGVLEGTGVRMGHVKFRTVGDVNGATWLEAYIRAAQVQAGLNEDSGDAQSVLRPRRTSVGSSAATGKVRGTPATAGW